MDSGNASPECEKRIIAQVETAIKLAGSWRSHVQIEQRPGESGLTWTVLRPGWMEETAANRFKLGLVIGQLRLQGAVEVLDSAD